MAVRRFSRSTGMKPIEAIAQPKNGHENSDFFARNRTWTGIVASSAGMSSQDSWLDMKTTGVSRGTRSAPCTLNRTKPPTSTRRAQIRAAAQGPVPARGDEADDRADQARNDRVDKPRHQEHGRRQDVEEQHGWILASGKGRSPPLGRAPRR